MKVYRCWKRRDNADVFLRMVVSLAADSIVSSTVTVAAVKSIVCGYGDGGWFLWRLKRMGSDDW